eukprot:CAMPEP_0206372720 /NCGR_PEP_ID=MMETSP0294-20121207/7276_1 /ASSEMBLY_ACC=CAM_ASM_000327 /TAXON_ID=39354 /ORGANISM="Heterosigma akashiwo, Strain CCMP2393" /LENGTH=655 /DNA_ID=CAMNT_0053820151 /DNA_START=139 /DNA_END=2103 /DNA_ORIENTATION=-
MIPEGSGGVASEADKDHERFLEQMEGALDGMEQEERRDSCTTVAKEQSVAAVAGAGTMREAKSKQGGVATKQKHDGAVKQAKVKRSGRKLKKVDRPQAFFDLIRALKATDRAAGLAAYNEWRDHLALVRSQYAARGETIPAKLLIPRQIYDGVLNLCGTPELLDRGKEVLADMRAEGLAPEERNYKMFIHEACGRGAAYGALFYINKMMEDGVTPRLRTFAPVLEVLAAQNDTDTLVETWERMRAAGVAPLEAQHVQALQCFARAGTLYGDWGAGWAGEFLGSLKETVFGVSPAGWGAIRRCFSGGAGGVPEAQAVRPADDGTCPCCGGTLRAFGLEADERRAVAAALEGLAAEGTRWRPEPAPEKAEALRQFGAWLGARPHRYDVVLDAPNIAYHGQNLLREQRRGGFSHHQVDLVKELLESMGHRVLVVIPERYMDREKIPNTTRIKKSNRASGKFYHPSEPVTDEQREIMDKWTAQGDIYTVAKHNNDDWYWMYATVVNRDGQAEEEEEDKEGHRLMVVTNDKMRDHRLSLLTPRPFFRWRSTQIMNFDIRKEQDIPYLVATVLDPPVFSREVQMTDNGVWHVPIAEKEDHTEGDDNGENMYEEEEGWGRADECSDDETDDLGAAAVGLVAGEGERQEEQIDQEEGDTDDQW